MFSPTLTKIINSSGAQAAMQRSAQIENFITLQTKNIQTLEPPKPTKTKSFEEYLELDPPPVFGIDTIKNIKKSSTVKKTLRAEINDIVKKAAATHGVDEKLILAVIKQESGFNPKAVSHCGAEGLMQLMPGTAKGLGVTDSFDPVQNVMGGTKYLKNLLKKYNGNIILALAAYNAGSGNVAKYNGVPPFKETQNYVKKVLANYLS